ncbi:hypothetical protein [Microbacterium sp. gxy059]|uniref:hypothetical protein n=1 Tax=Microbacterium sp. gxy059 TaxID=2957199 RepID=UPI003D96C1AF
MAITRRSRVLAVVGVIALVPAALTACSGGGQSTADACKIVNDGMTEITSNVNEVMSAASSQDIDTVNTLISDMNDEIASLGEEVTNEEVSAAFDDFAGSFQKVVDAAPQLAELDLTDPASADKANEIAEQVTDAQSEIMESGQAIQELCS